MLTEDMATHDDDAQIDVSNDTTNEPSLDDTLRETYKAIQSRQSADTESVEEKPQRVRAPDGKFVRAEDVPSNEQAVPDAGKPSASDKPADAQGDESSDAAKPVDATQNASAITPPAALKGSIKAKWATLDPEVQQEFIRRENDFHKGAEKYKQDVQQLQAAHQYATALHKAIEPFQQIIQQEGIPVDRAIGALLATDAKLRFGSPAEKAYLLAKMARDYGVDISQGLPEIPPIDPNTQMLQKQYLMQQQKFQQYVQQSEQERQQLLQAQQERERQELAEIIEKSRQGKEYFDDVSPHMAALLQGGQAKDIDDAYDQAVWARPDLRQKMLAKQQEQFLAEKTKEAQAAKQAASVNVPQRGTFPAAKPKLSQEDTMREILRKHGMSKT